MKNKSKNYNKNGYCTAGYDESNCTFYDPCCCSEYCEMCTHRVDNDNADEDDLCGNIDACNDEENL